MTQIAAKTAYGPTFQVAVEQWVPREQRIVHDAVAYQILPSPLRAFVQIFRVGVIRQAILGFVDRSVPGIRGGILCRKRYIEDALHVLCGRHGLTPEILGKRTGHLPEAFEYDPRIIRRGLFDALGLGPPPTEPATPLAVAPRPPRAGEPKNR